MEKLNKLFLISIFLTCAVLCSAVAMGTEAVVLYAALDEREQMEAQKIKLACDLLGIKLVTHWFDSQNTEAMSTGMEELHNKEVLIISNKVAHYFNKEEPSLITAGNRKRNILILKIDSDINASDLNRSSVDKIESMRKYQLSGSRTSIKINENKEITKELSGNNHSVKIPAAVILNCFEVEESRASASLIEVSDELRNDNCTIFAHRKIEGQSIFFLSDWDKVIENEGEELVRILPFLIFLRYSFGDRCWHRPFDFANFTIDDPWIREPYGYVSFAGICEEAKETPFHVTIGFIPYNYDKSRLDAVEIFRSCRENLSLAIHGNNHDFSEFREKKEARDVSNKEKFINDDEISILQALYRMNKLREETGISYDRVMIFPRGAFNKESLGILKKHNFLMTINSTRPFDPGDWEENADRLRGITLQYEKFPMVLRWNIPEKLNYKRTAEEIKTWIQIRLFLDLPVLLYGHVGFFKDGAQAFNVFAEMVNHAQPNVHWSDLSGIAKNLFLQRTISENEIEVVAYSSDIKLINDSSIRKKFLVFKDENFIIPIRSVEVNGVKYEYRKERDHIGLEVWIEPNCEKDIKIIYDDAFPIGSIVYSEHNFLIDVIRALSDFRDIYLSKLPYGDRVITLSYILGAKNLLLLAAGSIGFIIFALCWFIKYRRSRKTIRLT